MVNGSRYYRAHSISFIYRSYHLTMPDSELGVHQNADSLKLQLLTARKEEWWPATVDSLPQAVSCQL